METSTFRNLTKQAYKEERLKNFARAFNLYSQALGFPVREVTKVKLKSKQAWCLHFVGNYMQALEVFNSLLQEHPSEPGSYIYFANYMLKTDKLKLAKNTLRKAIEKFPEHLEAYLLLAGILKDTERSNEAIEILKKALSQTSLVCARGIHRKDLWAELGYLYYERGSYNSSIVAFKKSLRMISEHDFFHYDMLAKAYLKINDPQSAIVYIEKKIENFGDYDSDDLILKARIHARLGEYQYATSNLLQAYSIEDSLTLKNEDMVDFSYLLQNGFFQTLENFQFEEN